MGDVDVALFEEPLQEVGSPDVFEAEECEEGVEVFRELDIDILIDAIVLDEVQQRIELTDPSFLP